MKPQNANRLIATFTTTPKELFRMNKGTSVALRAFPTKPKGKYDLLTVAGKVIPKALDPLTYIDLNEKITKFLTTNGIALSQEEWMRRYPRATERF
ncbi:hypothetical protein P7C71_g2606, partial [Lecanoromycetidae sp. Uapishka_2]